MRLWISSLATAWPILAPERNGRVANEAQQHSWRHGGLATQTPRQCGTLPGKLPLLLSVTVSS